MENYRHIYFIGAGGIGMSALARYFNHSGFKVSGYDRTETELTKTLVSEGIDIHYHDAPELIPTDIDRTLVVLTPAIPQDFGELVAVREKGYKVMKRAEVLGLISRTKNCIGIAGTHGKTSITTLTSFIMHQSAVGCTAFLGGISKDYGTNYLLPNEGSDVMVVEADEFDRSFMQLSPDTALLTSTDADHLDIYGDDASIKETFDAYLSMVPNDGYVVYKKDIDLKKKDATCYSYALEDNDADFYASNIRVEDGGYTFDIHTPMGVIASCRFTYPGQVNLENCIGAVAVSLLNGVTTEEIRKIIPSYQGVKRRFDVQFDNGLVKYIDDYAHHPTEINATLDSIKALYPGKRVTGIFQPHLFSRTNDFYKGFGESLSQLDSLLLLDIYPAREKPMEGVTSDLIYQHCHAAKKRIISKNEVISVLDYEQFDILVTLGAGDIDTLVGPIREYLTKNA
ncbi:UDP-N-acetylmuramate--L-alanine ligase [Halosquirtibacter xylanolyticus]|uniref:UDP-N-acetylmuramate--L-alanine ligase n=1 Tax=Halosquirtibacter xylanolyticus TaxID=3374599 RepID=UPI003747FEF7|nr:UDP-N-acetylmuramate--L-alanine ligase [Prolixibacteraceae bacterium]